MPPDRRGPCGRYRYGTWAGGGDPLAPPLDVRAALDELGADVLEGSSMRDAMRRMLRNGVDGRRGLDALRRDVRRRRQRLQRSGDLAGTIDRVRQALDQVLAAEHEQLAGEHGDDARLAESELAGLPPDTAGAVRELASYDWHSEQARAGYAEIQAMLRSEVLDAQFAGMKQALSGQDPAADQAVRDMLADLNRLLAEHAAGSDTSEQFADFMERHGDFFPEAPRDTDDLIDLLARRQAAADRLMRSLTSDQRAELSELMAQAMSSDLDLQSAMTQLRDNLETLRPGMTSQQGREAGIDGEQGMGYGDAVGAVADLADLEALEAQLGQDYAGSTLDDVDVDALERQLAPSAVADLRALAELERELERQGYVRRGADGAALTPKALRRLGETTLRRIFSALDAGSVGDHDDQRTGAADERTGATLAWRFGDERPIDSPATVRNAVLRRAADPNGPRLHVEDFAVAETERRTGAAVALCVDLSFSMVQEDRWGPMKQTALALSHLVATRFRQDALQVIGFDRYARRLTPLELAEVEPEYVQGTNLHHALSLAGRHLRRHPEAEPVVLVVTDGEPTAHLEADGTAAFNWPPTRATLRATVAEVDAISRAGATMNVFRLGSDPGLARFVDAIARRNGGRVFSPSTDRLGEYVVADYLRTRGGRRRAG